MNMFNISPTRNQFWGLRPRASHRLAKVKGLAFRILGPQTRVEGLGYRIFGALGFYPMLPGTLL